MDKASEVLFRRCLAAMFDVNVLEIGEIDRSRMPYQKGLNVY